MEVETVSIGSEVFAGIGGIAGIIAIVGMVLERIGKAIPDSATGFWGVIRKLAKLVSLYTSNKE